MRGNRVIGVPGPTSSNGETGHRRLSKFFFFLLSVSSVPSVVKIFVILV